MPTLSSMDHEDSTGPGREEPLLRRETPWPHYRFRHLTLPHLVLTRHGGVSRGPYATLNLSFEVGDDPEAVRRNRERVKELLGCRCLVSARQVHGRRAFVVQAPEGDLEVEGYDILLTREPGVGLLVKQADCQGIVLHDPEGGVLALVHAGWRGLVRGVVQEAVRWAVALGARPERLMAAVGPTLQPCCAEFRDWRRIFPPAFHPFRRGDHFDLPGITASLLLQAGLRRERVFLSRLCTRCREEFFSYRREGRTGRFGTVACLQ